MNEFIDYVLSFYGVGGIYDYGVTRDEAIKATEYRLTNKGLPFEGDTVDREFVRDIIFEMRAAA